MEEIFHRFSLLLRKRGRVLKLVSVHTDKGAFHIELVLGDEHVLGKLLFEHGVLLGLFGIGIEVELEELLFLLLIGLLFGFGELFVGSLLRYFRLGQGDIRNNQLLADFGNLRVEELVRVFLNHSHLVLSLQVH